MLALGLAILAHRFGGCEKTKKAHLSHAAESDLLKLRTLEPLLRLEVMNVFGNR